MLSVLVNLIGGSFTVLLVLFVGFMIYGVWAEGRAERNARDFCQSVAIGSSYERALSLGADVGEPRLRRVGDSEITVSFTGVPPFSRQLCRIRGTESTVVSAKYLYMD